ncbi:MAG: SsrA-binding protein SmpB [Bacilli bacterium]|jgi:SsrA-binding protein|nr:SsrA-binding protein SmpB [Bacilli bacterium]MDD2681573.1 SsrA-binding protein SmpB [Bacilli bacterium]MDD3121826.1 SsrA-binding protein SmpB [Bacilli bacterium]MDD4063800.1 SsrA-binding protein SmpB [Bacilli bacterium]MDD4482667.1 SsrA-binding protein SmpB [Bacilli bacterium]
MDAGKKVIATNKKAYHDFFILDTYECGIVLTGTEIKSVRQNKISINEAYCFIEEKELFVGGIHIAKYEKGNIFNHDEARNRKLLAHKREIIRLESKVKEKGLTLIPLSVYLIEGIAKVEIALVKGKKLYDKREDLKIKTAHRAIEKSLKNRY